MYYFVAFSVSHRKSTELVDDKKERKDTRKPSDKQTTRYGIKHKLPSGLGTISGLGTYNKRDSPIKIVTSC